MLVEPHALRVFGSRNKVEEARFARVQRRAPLALVVVCIGAYIRTFSYGLYLDDYWLVRPWTTHDVLHAFVGQFDPSGLNPEYFRPLAPASFAFDWAVWGSTVWGSHVTNLVIHVVAVLLVHRLLQRLGVRWWAALGAAAYFAVVPSNVATVVYVAERTDAMAAICILVGLLCVLRYHRTRHVNWLVALAACYVVALLSKEIGLALVPMTFVWWWYLSVDATSLADLPTRGATATFAEHWHDELRRWRRALTDRIHLRDWLLVLGPLVGITVVYFVYRSAVLPAGSLSGRFGESQNPVSALVGGIDSTVKGVPWELRGWTLGPIALLFVVTFVLAPRARGWRIVILGIGLIIGGIAPLLYGGGVEPRLLYVAEIGMAVAMAGVLTVLGDIVATAVSEQRRVRPTVVVAVAMVAAVVLVSGASSIKAQDQFAEGTNKKLAADLRVWNEARQGGYVLPEHIDTIHRRLVADGILAP